MKDSVGKSKKEGGESKMKVGDKVQIEECHKVPELVGQEAEVIGVVSTEVEKYPILVKLLQGEYAGKISQFREEELKALPQGDEGIPPAFTEGMKE